MIEVVLITDHIVIKRYAPNRYYVFNTHNILLGDIYYFHRWHRFVFEPSNETLFDSSCLKVISDFLESISYRKE